VWKIGLSGAARPGACLSETADGCLLGEQSLLERLAVAPVTALFKHHLAFICSQDAGISFLIGVIVAEARPGLTQV
jgi:hypothetical protein